MEKLKLLMEKLLTVGITYWWFLVFIVAFLPSATYGQLPSDFQKVELLTGLKNSVNMEFAPDGRIFILDRYGELIIYKPDTQTNVSAGSLDVFHDMEDGLLAIAFDPQFPTNNFIYIHYSHPTLPKNRVSRFQMVGDILNISSEIVVLEWLSERNGYFHAAGDMDFDSQGNLYIAIGDNTDHSKYTTLNETNPHKSSERTSSNTNDLRGKILRIKPLSDGTYSIPPGNLFPDGEGGLPEIYVMGARNPYKIFVDKTNTDWLFWGEVGPDASGASNLGPEGLDEINLTKEAGNYGWPYLSGKNRVYLNTYADPNFYYDPNQPVNISQWNTGAVNLPPAQPAWIDFFHKCYLAGPRYYFDTSIDNPKKLPSHFDNLFFFYDFNSSKIWVTQMDNNGNILSTEQFAPGVITGSGFIDLKIGPDGQLYILEYGSGCCPSNVGTGKLVRLDYNGIDSNQAPQVNISADVTSGSLPLTVNFSSEGTLDPDGDPLTFEWDFQSDGIVDSYEENPSFIYTEKGTFNAQLRVDDSNGGISSKSITIGAGNNAATFDFVYPPNGGMVTWYDKIEYKVIVNDEEDGTTEDGSIDCSQLNFVPSFGHLSHSHDGLTINQCEGTYYLDPGSHDTEGFDDIYQVFKVNYTDSDGLTSFDQITVHPKLMEAEFYDLEYNTQLIDNSDLLGGGIHSVRALSHGAYLMLDKRNLHNIESVSYRVASALGGQIEVRSGTPDGPIINNVQVPNTGGLSNWIIVEAPITNPGGTNDLYFIFTNSPGATNLFDVNYIEFHGTGVSIDETPPEVSSLEVLSFEKISVKFNESLDKNSAELVSNYSINNGIAITSATLQADRRTVLLTTTAIGSQVEYELTVSNLQNESGLMIFNSLVKKFTFQGTLFRINAGGPAMELEGIQWGQSQYNSGGSVYTNTSLEINNTNSDPIYQTELFGNFTYNFPVPDAGIYDVSLHFAELYFKTSGSRVFNVDVENGQYSLTNYDIVSNVGYATADIIKFFGINVEDGFLTIKFTSVKDKAKISAIEVFYGKETVQQPSISIVDPKDNAQVEQPFYLNFMVSKWEVSEGTTHIHKFVNDVFEGEVYTLDSILFEGLTLGQHNIQLVLVNADHSPTEYNAQIQVNVVDELTCIDNPFPLQWSEQLIGSAVAYRSVYIFSEDLDGDGFRDIVTGGWWYKNPGTPGATWIKKEIGAPMNNMSLIHDFDNDGDLDIFGTQGTYTSAKMAWAQNDGIGNFTIHTNIPDGTSTYSETFMAGAALGNFNGVANTQIAVVWNGAESSNSSVQMLTVPADPANQSWTIQSISEDSYGEAISAGDIDGDGDLDLFQAGNWLRNDNGSWTTFSTSLTLPTHFDRNALADLDNNGSLDGVVTQIGTNQEISWFKPPQDPTKPWSKETIGSGVYGGLSLSLVDMDGDGDLDVLSGEWKGNHRLLAFENDLCNSGTWISHVLHPGGSLDHHDSAIPVDLDNDGDLDIISIGWDQRVPRIYWNIVNSDGNSSPQLVNPLPEQIAVAGVAYNFILAENTFTDPDGDALIYTASLANGSALPLWLSFDGPSRTFSGTPGPTDVGTVEIRVTASDGSLSISDQFNLSVASEYSTDFRINAGGGQLTAYGTTFAADQSFNGGGTYSNTKITDIAGTAEDGLYKTERYGAFSYNVAVPSETYTVKLHFAEIYFGATGGGTGGAGKRVFNVTGEGQPLLTNFDIFAEVGAMTALVKEFEVNVTDGILNLFFSKVVDNAKVAAIQVISNNGTTNPPPVANAGADQTVTADASGQASIQLNGSGSSDPDGTIDSYVWTQGGTQLATGATPTVSLPVGTHTITLTVTDNQGATGTDQVTVTVTGSSSENQAPIVANSIPNQSTTAGVGYNFPFAQNTFSDPDGDALVYTASLANGSALPLWLSFDGPSRTFSGTPGPTDVGTVEIRVTASDGSLSISDQFNLSVASEYSTDFRINAGGGQLTAYGTTFAADQSFNGGGTYSNTKITDIAGTAEDGLYKTERYGAFSYNVAVPSETYTVKLHFAEIYFGATGGGTGGAGKRVFNVTGEGQPLLTNFDIFAEVGAMTALVKEFEVNVTDGILNLFFSKVVDNAKVAAIEIIAGAAVGEMVASPGSLQFYLQEVGTTSESMAVTLTNNETASVEVSSIGTTGANGNEFAHDFTGPVTLDAGASTVVNTTFTPTSAGNKAAQLEVIHTGSSPSMIIGLSGEGTEPSDGSPVVVNPIPDQNATEGVQFTFTFEESTFSDPNGDDLTFSASQSNESLLPSWLSFDGPTRTFTGMPGSTDLGTVEIRVTASDGTLSTSDLFNLTVTSVPATAIRINSGGGQLSAYGTTFSADQSFSGGKTFTNTKITDIAGTTDDGLYKSERFGIFNYNVAVPSGTYTLKLHFAEIYFGATGGGTGGAGKRVFNVTAEGQPLLTNFDIFAEVGSMTALVKEFEVSVTDGTLNLAFSKVVENPKVSALEIISLSGANFKINLSANDAGAISTSDSLNILDQSTVSQIMTTSEGRIINVYPNPFEDIINVEFPAEELQEYRISVYDVAGKIHYQNTFTSSSTEQRVYSIDLVNKSLITGGVYLIFIESVNGNYLEIFKMVKK